MTKAPAYQHYAQDWLVGTAHLTLEAQGAYQRLLDHQWVDGLPNDLEVLQRMLGVDAKTFKRIWKQIEGKFPVKGGARVNPRLDTERRKQAEYREVRRRAGKAGADSRWHGSTNGEAIPEPMANGMANDSPSSSSTSSSVRTEPNKGPTALSELVGDTLKVMTRG